MMTSKGNRVLITGGSGFIGTNLIDYSLAQGHTVLNIDILPPRNKAHTQFWNQLDILNLEKLKKVIQDFNPDYIYHMAARTDLSGKKINDYLANIEGVSNVLEIVRNCSNLNRILFASSRLVCKIGYQPKHEEDYCPSTAYGESKVIGENIIRKNKTIPCSWMIVRPTSIWGPWFDIPYKTFFLAIARRVYFHPGKRNINKSFGYVGNTVFELNKLMTASTKMVNGRTFYLADYPPVNVRKMADLIQEEMGVEKIRTIPVNFLKLFALIGDTFKLAGWSNPPLTRFRLNNLLLDMIYDLEPLKDIVGDLPFSLENGIKETVAWLNQTGEIGGKSIV